MILLSNRSIAALLLLHLDCCRQARGYVLPTRRGPGRTSRIPTPPLSRLSSVVDADGAVVVVESSAVDASAEESLSAVIENENNNAELTLSIATTTRKKSSNRKNSISTWQRRLITREDPWSFHKIASIGYTVTTTILLGTAVSQAVRGEFEVIPLWLEPVMNAFTVSNIVMCAASVRMALVYRRSDIPSRNAFLGTAVSSLFSGFFMVWISPWGDAFYDTDLSRAVFAVLVGLNTYFIADSMLKRDDLIEGRRDRTAEDYEGRKLLDTLGYIGPIAFGLPLIAATGYLASVAHDRAWFLEQCRFIDRTLLMGGGMQAHIFYQQLSTSLGASYASLFVTLRDKRLISKEQEMIGIVIFALPAFVWSVYTTYYFMTSLFMQ